MCMALVGAGSSTLLFFSLPGSSILSPFVPVDRLPRTAGFSSNCLINISSNRLTPRWERRCIDSTGYGSDASVSEEDVQEDWVSLPSPTPYQILGIDPNSCTSARLKAAFRSRVKKFHPDIYKGSSNSDEVILRIINAYEMLSKHIPSESVKSCRPASDPFEDPECVASDIFVNELQCVGRGCQYSCVKRSPNTFSFTGHNGTARAVFQGHLDDYQVQLAVAQCPARCIHYVTSSQKVILHDVLQRVLNNPFDVGEISFLEALISKANFENRRYQKPKGKPRMETEYVDWS